MQDLLTDILSRGKSSRLYNSLLNRKTFTEINAYHTADFDQSLLVVEGKLVKGVSMEQAEAGIQEEIQKIVNETVPMKKLQKVKKKVESTMEFSERIIQQVPQSSILLNTWEMPIW